MPALLTRTSMLPKRSRVARTMASRSARRVTSVEIASDGRPSLVTSSAVRCALAASSSATTMVAPIRASSSAVARPIPRPPPVTMATCLSSSIASPSITPAPASVAAGSETASPERAIAPDHEGQVGLVARPRLVLRQLQLFLRRLPALALARHGLHRLGRVLQERELVLDVLLGAEPITGPGMTGDHLVPVHRQHLLDRAFDL